MMSTMNLLNSAIIICAVFATAIAKDCLTKKTSNSKLFCYYGKLNDVDSCKCSHVILPENSDVKAIERVRDVAKGVKILITVNEFNQGLVDILKSSKVDGIELDLKKLDSKSDINDFISTVRTKLGSDLYIALSVPAKPEALAKYYDFKTLSKSADVFLLQTAFLGASKNVTFHPSRLSGLWDMQNTDSVVDLVSGLGAPLAKLVIAAPVQGFHFRLQDEKHTAPGSPAVEIRSVTRDELCRLMGDGGNWTLERDQDQSGPYIFSKDQWIAFDDATSVDIKAKYSRVRGLAGIALKDVSQDGGEKCGSSILDAAFQGLSRQARAPRGAVLHSLEREILETPARPLDNIQVSPYRISRVIDVEGNVHVIRQDTRTEFACSRQGYFVHPRSCNRFYRCVKFDQLSDEFSVFEFDCPAGLAFDERVEVCVWPGSLPHASACSGSSEIAPVPRERFICPGEPGYYADPENCRWFFACLDHGKSPLSAYEFRCPFGLVFDKDRLLCEWSWLVPKCGSGYAIGSEVVYGGSSSVAIDQYNGLGVLGVTALGGLHGPLQQPEAKIYSNVGTLGIASGNSIGIGTNQIYGNAGDSIGVGGTVEHGYNNAGAIGVAYGSTLGTSEHGYSNAGSAGIASGGALEAAGHGYSNVGTVGIATGGDLGSAGHGYSNVATVGIATGGALGSAGHSYSNIGTSGQDAGGNFGTSGQVYSNTGTIGLGIASFNGDSSGGYQGSLSQNAAQSLQKAGLLQSGYSGTQYVTGSHGNYGQYAGGFGLKTDQNLYAQNQAAFVVTGEGSGAKSQQSYTQYYDANANAGLGFDSYGVNEIGISGAGTAHAINGLSYDNTANYQNVHLGGTAGAKSGQSFVQYHGNEQDRYNSGNNVNIVGGGYSAVGIANSGIEISNNGEGSSTISHVTQSPVTVASVPTVATVPVPVLKSDSGFQSYQGGVVANLPELQYRIQKPNVHFNAGVPVANVTNFVNVASTANIGGGYQYPKPSVAFVEQPTVYKQAVTFSTTPAPVVYEKINVQPAVVESYHINKQSSFEGYDYPKPAVKFEETPVIGGSFSYQNTDTVHKGQGYVYEKPSIAFEEVGVKAIQQPAVVTYSQPRPFVKVQQVQPVVNVQPSVQTVVQPVQPATSYSSFQKHDTFQGYEYQKPSIAFEEKPRVVVSSYSNPSTVKPVIVEQYPQIVVSSTPAPVVQPAVVSSFSISSHQPVVQQNVHKQVIVEQYPQAVVSSTAAPVVQPAVTYQRHETFQGYDYPKPSVQFEEKPQIVATSYSTPSTVRPPVFVTTPAPAVSVSSFQKHNNFQGYEYTKPSITFEEKPQVVVTSYNEPSTVRAPVVQPALSVSTFQKHENVQGYDYPKPSVVFEEKPQVVATSYYQPSTVRPQVFVTTPAPVVQQEIVQPAISYNYEQKHQTNDYYYSKPAQPVATYYEQPKPVSTYNYKNVVQQSVGYSYPKPAVAFEETPIVRKPAVVSSYSYTAPTQRPVVVQNPVTVQPVVATYSYTAPSTVKPAVFVQQPLQPAVSSYSFASTPKPEVLIRKQPAVVSSYSYTAPTVKPVVQKAVEFSGYDYPKPAVSFVEQPIESRQPVEEIPFVAKKAYVTTHQKTDVDGGYVYEKPAIRFEEKPAIVESYQSPTYYTTSKPIVDYAYVQSTPKPTFETIIQPVAPKQFYYYDNKQSKPKAIVQTYSTAAPTVQVVTTSRPIVRYSFSSLPTATTVENYVAPIEVTQREYLPPVTTEREYLPPVQVTSRPRTRVRVTTERQYLPPVTTEREYLPPVTSEREYLPPVEVTLRPRNRVRITTERQYLSPVTTEGEYLPPVTSEREYLPPVEVTSRPRSRVRITTERQYLSPVTTEREYLPPVTSEREYLPPRGRVRVTTAAPSREYLPSEEVVLSTRRPVKIVKVVSPKTIVKQNDFHPLLSAKLGAQCTCASNTVKLRKKPVRIIVEEEEDDDDGYGVNPNNNVVVENYQYEPQRIVDITPTPQVAIKSTASTVDVPVQVIRKKVRVRPVTSTTYTYDAPVTEAVEVFVRKSSTPAIAASATNDGPSDREIAKAVRTGLKLVKQAAKEGTEEALNSRDFDRYGPGGVRSRNERLQGTVDCQRAGLFRHPTQCNKFYACRWDCTKNKYTLHVFNCPVHLTFDNSLGACNWPSQGPACLENTLLPSD